MTIIIIQNPIIHVLQPWSDRRQKAFSSADQYWRPDLLTYCSHVTSPSSNDITSHVTRANENRYRLLKIDFVDQSTNGNVDKDVAIRHSLTSCRSWSKSPTRFNTEKCWRLHTTLRYSIRCWRRMSVRWSIGLHWRQRLTSLCIHIHVTVALQSVTTKYIHHITRRKTAHLS